MEIEHIGFKATINTGAYENIQPEISLTGDFAECRDFAEKYLDSLFEAYSMNGPLKKKDIQVKGETKKSFNEPGVNLVFEPIAHTYHYNGKRLESATGITKKFYKPFDNEKISAVSAKAWGVTQAEVKRLWKDNGDLTSSFGTVVHKMIENYLNNGLVGATIAAKKSSPENYCIPKHPILKKILNGFIAIHNIRGEPVSEALLTSIEDGICGHTDIIDVLDWEKKVCRIQDVKVNIDSETADSSLKVGAPFSHLPATKLSKYQIQMSIYANMLQKVGWTVEGLDAYVLEDGWKHYKLEVLKVI